MISIIRDRQSQTSSMIISVLIIIYWRFLHFVVCFLTWNLALWNCRHWIATWNAAIRDNTAYSKYCNAMSQKYVQNMCTSLHFLSKLFFFLFLRSYVSTCCKVSVSDDNSLNMEHTAESENLQRLSCTIVETNETMTTVRRWVEETEWRKVKWDDDDDDEP